MYTILPDVLGVFPKSWWRCGVPSYMREGVERKSTSQKHELPPLASSGKPRPDAEAAGEAETAAELLKVAAPQCLAGSAHTHPVTCCQSATAADLVSMGEMSFAKVMILKDKTHSCIAWQTSHRFSRVETKDSLGKKELPRHLSGLQWNAQWCQTENGRTVDETNEKEIIATSYIFISNIASSSTWSKHQLA